MKSNIQALLDKLGITPEQLVAEIMGDINSEAQPVVPTVTLTTYKCSSCRKTIESDIVKKRCPHCKKHKLVAITEETSEPQSRRTTIHIPSENPHRSEGESNKKPTRKESINVNKIRTSGNLWHDDGKLYKTKPAEKRKQKKLIRSERRPPVKLAKVTCSKCNIQQEVHPLHLAGRSVWTCNECIGGK